MHNSTGVWRCSVCTTIQVYGGAACVQLNRCVDVQRVYNSTGVWRCNVCTTQHVYGGVACIQLHRCVEV